MTIDENISRIHEFIVKAGYKSTEELFDASVVKSTFDFDALHNLFKLSKNLPTILRDDAFTEHKGTHFFSGTTEYKKNVDLFQRGAFRPVKEHKVGRSFGYGYYCTNSIRKAGSYRYRSGCDRTNSPSHESGIIIMKLADHAKVSCFYRFRQMLKKYLSEDCEDKELSITPTDSHKKQKLIIYKALYYNYESNTALASAFGYDGLLTSDDIDSDNSLLLLNRSAVVQPENPDASRFMEVF